jgi:O-antigen ligase
MHLQKNNLYLQYAPDYNKTIVHDKFDNLIAATYKGEDISTMERVYRWVAAMYMVRDKPLTGFGPGNFYNSYKPYTVTAFQTYVSNNPERSGIHNYYLMVLVEQGIPGICIYLLLILYTLWRGQKLYLRVKTKEARRVLITALLMLVSIHILQTINDLIETDKIGSFFLLCTSMVVCIETFWLPQSNLQQVKQGG